MNPRATRTPSIPDPSKDNLVDAVGNIKDLLDVREGRSGDPLDANVTYRDLKDLGLADTPSALAGVAGTVPATGRPVVVPPWVNPVPWSGDNYDPTADLNTPPTPGNLIAAGAYSSINLTWTYATYRNHAYTEVYRSAVDDLGTAVLIGTNQAPMFNDPVGTEKAYYYWVRNVSMANVKSEFNSASGAYAATALDVARRIAEVERQVLSDPLAKQLQTRIAKIEAAGYASSADLQTARQEIATIRAGLNNDVANVRSALYSSIGVQGSNIIDLQTVTTNQAKKITALGTRMGNAENSIVTISKTNATQASQITTLDSVLTDPVTGLEATRATLTTDYYTKADTNSAIANADLTLNTSFNNTLSNYATTANLDANYYTKSDTDFALTQMSVDLTSKFNNQLTGYATTAYVSSFSYAKSAVDYAIATNVNTLESSISTVSASVTNVEQTKIGYATLDATGLAFDNNGAITDKAGVDAWNTANPTNKATWNVGLPLATAVKQVSVSDGASSLTLEQRFTAQATTNSNQATTNANQATTNSNQATTNATLNAQYTVKIDNNGFVTGFGLASSVVNGTPFSSFMVNANRFAVLNPNGTAYEISSLTRSGTVATLVYTGAVGVFSSGGTVTLTGVADGLWNGVFTLSSVSNNTLTFTVSGSATTPAVAASGMTMKVASATVPFVVDSGVTYINAAAILDASIKAAKIETLNADKITTGNLTATLSVTTGKISSANYGASGFFLGSDGGIQKLYVGDGANKYLQWDGSDLSVRGTVYADAGSFAGSITATSGAVGGNTITASAVSSPGYSAGSSGWTLKSDGTAEFGAASIRGQVTASQINANGLTITDDAGNPLLVSGTGLKFGIGSNLIPNSDFADGTGFLAAAHKTTTNTPTFGTNRSGYVLGGSALAYMTVAGSTSNGQVFSAQIKNGGNQRFPAVTGQRYEFSAYLNVTGCRAYIGIIWYNSSGTAISGGEVTSGYYTKTGTVASLADLDQASMFATAPTGAVTAFLYVRGESTGSSDPYVYFTRVQFCEASSSQNTVTPWSPGRGVGQITSSNASTYIADLAVGTLQIAGNAATVPVALDQSSTVYWYDSPTTPSAEWTGDASTLYWKTVVSNITVAFGTVNATNKAVLGFSYQANAGSGGAWFSRWRIVRNDTTVIKYGDFGIANNTGGPTVSAIVFDDNTGNGNVTYKLQVAIWGDILSFYDSGLDKYIARTVTGGTLFALGAKR